ncbi:MAG: hypothetical protein OD817_07770 [Gammaproteobacteria bacterium]
MITLHPPAGEVVEEAPLHMALAAFTQSAAELSVPFRITHRSHDIVDVSFAGEAFVGVHTYTATFAPGAPAHTLRFEIPRDGIVEGNETFRVELLTDDAAWPAGYGTVGAGMFDFTLRDVDRVSFQVQPVSVLLGASANLTAELLTGEKLNSAMSQAANIEGCDIVSPCSNETDVINVRIGNSISWSARLHSGISIDFTFTDTAGRGGRGAPDGVLSHDERIATATWQTTSATRTGQHRASLVTPLRPELQKGPVPQVVVDVQEPVSMHDGNGRRTLSVAEGGQVYLVLDFERSVSNRRWIPGGGLVLPMRIRYTGASPASPADIRDPFAGGGGARLIPSAGYRNTPLTGVVVPRVVVSRDALSENPETFIIEFDTGHANWPAGFRPHPTDGSVTVTIRDTSG